MRTLIHALILALVIASPVPLTAAAGGFGYAVDTQADLYVIDLASATEIYVGDTGITDLVEALASDPSGNLYATTTVGNLYQLDTATGAATLLGNHGAGDLEGLDFADGALLGIDYNRIGGLAQDIYRVSRAPVGTTIIATLDRNDIITVSTLAIGEGRSGFIHGVLTIGVGSLFAVDIDSGHTVYIGDLTTPLTGLDFDGSTLFGLGFDGAVFRVDPASAEMQLVGNTVGGQAWLGFDIPKASVSTLECGGTGVGGNNLLGRAVRFHTDTPFHGIQLRLEGIVAGDYFFDAELRRSDGVTSIPERIVPGAAIGMTGSFASPPYLPVTIDFGLVPVAGHETFTVAITNIVGPPAALVFETFGFGVEPCAGVEELDTFGAPPPSVVGDPAGFKLLTDPNLDTPLLVCEMPGVFNGDLASSRGVRFTTDRDFRATELRFNSTTPGTYSFDMELRRSSGFIAPVERIAESLSVNVPGGLNVQPFRPVTASFGDAVRVIGPETFTLKMTNISGPGSLLFETYGIGNTPCPDVQQTEQNNVAVPTERGDPAGYRLLADRNVPVQTLWCPIDGIAGYSTLVRGVRFTTPDPFSAVELHMDGPLPGVYHFTTQLRRSPGFVVSPERVIRGVPIDVPGNATAHPYEQVAHIDFGEPLAPGTYTLKFIEVTGPESVLFFDVNANTCASDTVQATLQNSVATPEVLGSPSGFRLLLRPDTDQDGLSDFVDNCILVANPDQRDTDMDGIGNACDGDFNNDCITNTIDLGIMKLNFFRSGDHVTDMSGDEVTNVIDLGLLKGAFFAVPGPAAGPALCQ